MHHENTNKSIEKLCRARNWTSHIQYGFQREAEMLGVLTMAKEEIEIKIDEHTEKAKLRTFSSGKTGFGLYGKVIIDGERYQVSCNIVKLG